MKDIEIFKQHRAILVIILVLSINLANEDTHCNILFSTESCNLNSSLFTHLPNSSSDFLCFYIVSYNNIMDDFDIRKVVSHSKTSKKFEDFLEMFKNHLENKGWTKIKDCSFDIFFGVGELIKIVVADNIDVTYCFIIRGELFNPELYNTYFTEIVHNSVEHFYKILYDTNKLEYGKHLERKEQIQKVEKAAIVLLTNKRQELLLSRNPVVSLGNASSTRNRTEFSKLCDLEFNLNGIGLWQYFPDVVIEFNKPTPLSFTRGTVDEILQKHTERVTKKIDESDRKNETGKRVDFLISVVATALFGVLNLALATILNNIINISEMLKNLINHAVIGIFFLTFILMLPILKDKRQKRKDSLNHLQRI